nr:MAG TPA: hypothetical protein [Caudoviricetes sp.]
MFNIVFTYSITTTVTSIVWLAAGGVGVSRFFLLLQYVVYNFYIN